MSTWRLFCFGLGYTGLTLSRAWRNEGWLVAGTCRSQEKADRLRREGIAAFVFDGEEGMTNIAEALAGTTHLLSSAPPDEQGDAVLRLHGRDLEQAAGTLQWAGYLSTTGIYGDCAGEWIDETRAPAPLTAGNQRRLEAERAWLDFGERTGVPTQIFRLPGIYGPDGRNVLDSLRGGHARRIVKPGQVFNRIHVDDLVAVLLASMARPSAGTVYNVSDDEPAPANEVMTFAADLLGVTPPPEERFEDSELSPFARHFYAECKRVRNHRIKEELGIRLRYPTYREGLRAIATGSP